MRKIFQSNRELLQFANENEIKVYSAKNVKTREHPYFGVWVMEWKYQGKGYSIEETT